MKRNLVEPTGIKMLKEAFCVFDGGLGVYWSTVFPSQALRVQSLIFQEESRLLEMLVVRYSENWGQLGMRHKFDWLDLKLAGGGV